MSGIFHIRYIIMGVMCYGTLMNYMLRININIAIVTMTKNNTELCHRGDYRVIGEDGEEIFCWGDADANFIKAAFFYGYVLLQLPGGILAEIYGSKIVLGASMISATVLNLLIPSASAGGVWVVFVCRFLLGFVEGVYFPAMTPLIVRWYPESERSRAFSISAMGSSVGTILTYPLCGLLLHSFGWKSVFYVTGALSSIWWIVWIFWMTDEPENHKWISPNEKEYIIKNRPPQLMTCQFNKPYLAILTHPSVWLGMIMGFCQNWAFTILLIQLPSIMSNVMNKDISSTGFISSLPYIARLLTAFASGIISDFLINRKWLSFAHTRKLMEILGFGVPALCLVLLGFITDKFVLAVIVLCIAVGFNGFATVGHSIYPMDISKAYCGTIVGFCNGFGNISGFLTPYFTHLFTGNDVSDPEGWKYLFLSGSGFYILGLVLYVTFAKFEETVFLGPFSFFGRRTNRDEATKAASTIKEAPTPLSVLA